jgi:hypothetical protein
MGGSLPRLPIKLPLSFQQQAIWFLNELIPWRQRCAFNLCYQMHLKGTLDVEAARTAVRALSHVHPILRTRIWDDDGYVWQSPDAEAPALRVLNVTGHPEPAAEADRIVEAEATRVMDIAAGPLSAFTLIRIGPDDSRFVMNMHHLIADGTSIHLTHASLAAIYSACVSTGQVPAIEPDVPYRCYVEAQSTRCESGALAEHERYWDHELASSPDLPEQDGDGERSARSFRGDDISLTLDRALVDTCRRVSRPLRAPESSFLLAAFARALADVTGNWHVVVGTGFSGRDVNNPARKAVGLFLNDVRLSLRLDPRWSCVDVVRHVAAQHVAAYDHQDYPLQFLIERLSPRRSSTRPGVYGTVYSYQLEPTEEIAWAGLTEVRFARQFSGNCYYDLVLSVLARSDEVVIRFDYSVDAYSRRAVTGIAQRYVEWLERFADECASAVH